MTRNPEGARPDPRDHSNLPVLRDAAHRGDGGHDPYLNAQLPDDEIDLREIWRIIAKYRWTIIVFAMLVVVTVGVANVLMRPVYKATTTVEIAPDLERRQAREHRGHPANVLPRNRRDPGKHHPQRIGRGRGARQAEPVGRPRNSPARSPSAAS
ncbi:MAG: Wzz/FepE/Etk N-terminal domain-containing protein [Gammaproteobacteria bacterium]|nr:Wzz/FepE/Etk N-terminal domain-containing protein [Gammaproteobacteria bacterium]